MKRILGVIVGLLVLVGVIGAGAAFFISRGQKTRDMQREWEASHRFPALEQDSPIGREVVRLLRGNYTIADVERRMEGPRGSLWENERDGRSAMLIVTSRTPLPGSDRGYSYEVRMKFINRTTAGCFTKAEVVAQPNIQPRIGLDLVKAKRAAQQVYTLAGDLCFEEYKVR